MSMIDEIWRDITGYEKYLQVSSLGRVRKKAHPGCEKYVDEKILRIQKGYVFTSIESKKIFFSVIRLVADAFLPPRPTATAVVKTINENNNYAVDNICWFDKEEIKRQKQLERELAKIRKQEEKKKQEKEKELKKRTGYIIQMSPSGRHVRKYIDIDEILSVHPTWDKSELLKCLEDESGNSSMNGWKFIYEKK